MILHRLRLNNFRGVQDREICFPAHGVVVVCGPNEIGKSSMLEALDLLLTYRDRSNHRDVKQVKTANADVGAQVEAEVAARWPGHETRFRSSTNSEDLGTFTGAGLYQSHTGRPVITDPASSESLAGAIRATWATIWSPRAWEEREYWSIDHHQVGMGLLVTENFGEEEANGVAVTNNVYDLSGFEPAFYVNVQIDDNEVVQPELGVIADAYLHYFSTPGSPVVYIQHSNLIPAGETVLSAVEVNTLGVALDAIHAYFQPVYGATGGWYGMDVEFKFDDKDTPGTPQLFIKQARPYPGWQ